VSSSPADDAHGAEPVELFLIGRTLRGTLGETLREQVVTRFESRHGHADAPLNTALSRTVELTAVAVTRAGAVRVDVGIADSVFRSALDVSTPAPASASAGEQLFEVDVDAVPGIRAVAGPPGVDRSRRAVVRVQSAHPVDLEVTVVPID
jgi:hypothetical protein